MGKEESNITKDEWFAEALRLADEYAMAYDHHNFIEEGAEQAKAARAALAAHLIIQPTA